MTNVFLFGLAYTNTTPFNLNLVTKNLSETLNTYKGSSQLGVHIAISGCAYASVVSSGCVVQTPPV